MKGKVYQCDNCYEIRCSHSECTGDSLYIKGRATSESTCKKCKRGRYQEVTDVDKAVSRLNRHKESETASKQMKRNKQIEEEKELKKAKMKNFLDNAWRSVVLCVVVYVLWKIYAWYHAS